MREIKRILSGHRVRKASLFGSVARGGDGPKSDVDILFDPPPGFSLFEMAEMKGELELSLGKSVDLVTFRSVSDSIKPYVNRDARAIM